MTSIVNRCHCSPVQAIAVVKKTPELLNEFPPLWEACDMLKNIGMKIIHGPLFADSIVIAHQYNLLATDAAHVAAMKRENLVNLATNDADFSRVQFLHLWRPESG